MYKGEGLVAVMDLGDVGIDSYPPMGTIDLPETMPIGDQVEDYLRRLGHGAVGPMPTADNRGGHGGGSGTGNTGGHQGGNSEHENPSGDKYGGGTSADKAGNQKK